MSSLGCSDRSRPLGGLRACQLVVVSVSALMVLPFSSGAVAAAAPNAVSARTCSGTLKSPGVLARGTYSSVEVTGVCAVKAGQVVVTGNVTVEGSKGVLVATFARNGRGAGTSGITVRGNLLVENGATLLLGCFASSSPCNDDPHKKTNPTLNSPDFVDGDLLVTDALGVIVHDGTILGDVREVGGGGGTSTGPGANCTPTGIFAAFGSPVFSDYEDSTIGGNLSVTGCIRVGLAACATRWAAASPTSTTRWLILTRWRSRLTMSRAT